MDTKKLYLVKLRGMNCSIIGSGITYGTAYVVATDPGEAVEKVQISLRQRDIGYEADRELKSIELIAEEYDYPDCKTILYL